MVLCRYVKAACPQQAIDEYTPDAWHDLLGDIEFSEAHRAAKVVATRQPFVAPAEIRNEVARHRKDVLELAGKPVPPRELADDPRRENAWIGEWRRAVVAGATAQQAEESAHALLGTQRRSLEVVKDFTAITEAMGKAKCDRKARPRDGEGAA